MFTTDELKRSKLCCVLGETELTRFAEKAADVRLSPGEWLIREGEPPWFYVLFKGKLRIVKNVTELREGRGIPRLCREACRWSKSACHER